MVTERSPRHCPHCGALGILPLDQPHDPDGGITDPIMLCPVCNEEFRAVGAKWLGAFRPPDNATDEERDRWAQDVADLMAERAAGWTEHGDDDPTIDICGGPEEPDPEFVEFTEDMGWPDEE